MARIDFAVACQGCATPLTGMDSGGECPTCGRPIAETVDDRIIELATGMVAVDLACVHCSYNLRTLKINAACPECGTAVSKSLVVEELRFCDPAWLRRIRRGINTVLLSVLASIVLAALGGIAVALIGFMRVPTARAVLLLTLPSVIGYALAIIGAFYITSPKPDEPGDDRANRIGRMARGLLLGSFALTLISIIIADPFAMMTRGSFSGLSFSLGVVQSILYCGAAIGVLIVLSRVALLGRRRGLQKLGKVLAWLVGLYALGQAATTVYTFLSWPMIAPGLPAPALGPTTTSTPATMTVRSNLPGAPTIAVRGNTPGTATIGSAGPAAIPSSAGTAPVPSRLPTRSMGGFVVFGCFTGIVTLGVFILGLITLVKYRNLLNSAITASVTSARLQPAT